MRAATVVRASKILQATTNAGIYVPHAKNKSYKVLCIGNGSGGVSVAATLSKKLGKGDVGIIEPSEFHYQQPLWTLVGAGLKDLNSTVTKMSDIIPKKAEWIKNRVTAINPENNFVELSDGTKIGYEYLVVAAGIELNFGAVKGLQDAIGKDGVCSNYSVDTVLKTREFLESFKGGNALFTMPATPIKCPGAPQKIAYLAEEKFRDLGVRDKSSVKYYTGIGKIFGIDKYAASMWNVANKRNIGVNLLHNLVEVDANSKVASFKVLGDGPNAGNVIQQEYDFLHVTPPMKAYDFIKNSKLADATGFLDVDRNTMQHKAFDNIYGLGDCTNIPTSKTAAAAVVQASVVKSNLYNRIVTGKNINYEKYDGYTSCPLITGKNSVVLAEFNGFTGKPRESFFFNQGKERAFSYWLTADMLPQVYNKVHLKGEWSGPLKLRPILNPFDSN